MLDESLRLSYKKYGKGDPFVILHGLFGASGNWHTLARSVFCRYYTVYTLDLRNHGRSPHADAIDYPHMAADLRRFLDDHGLDNVHLMGHSMGGKAAMELALSAPERVDKLIVVDIAPKAYPPYHTDILEALMDVDLSKMNSRVDVDHALADRIPDPAVRRFLLKNLSYNSDKKSYGWDLNLEAINGNYGALNDGISNGRKYEGPTLFLRGGDSGYVKEEDKDAIRELFPAAEFETIENAGHWVHADKPEAFADRVRSFLG